MINGHNKTDEQDKMSEAEIEVLQGKLIRASDEDLVKIFAQMRHANPFKVGGNRYLLPSVIRVEMIKKIVGWFRSGDLVARKS